MKEIKKCITHLEVNEFISSLGTDGHRMLIRFEDGYFVVYDPGK